jgi:2-hydroxy-3-oxopropionate reductase
MEKIAFIGLGSMGKPMATNLVKAGFPLRVYDIAPAPVAEMKAMGAVACSSPREAAEGCDVVFTMVPNTDNVRQALFGKDGIAESIRPGAVFVDTSSVNPHGSKEFCEKLAAMGVEMLDAPVSGGDLKAMDGTMSIMVGGKQSTLDKVRHILDILGGSVVLCGDIGAGNVTKLANQIIVAGNMMIMGEALGFAKKCGVSPRKIFEATRGGLAGSAIQELKVPKMLSGDFKPGGMLKYQIKDGDNVLLAAREYGAHIPLSVTILEMIRWLCDNGYAEHDHSSVVCFYEEMNRVKVQDGAN